jgi:hypothetical protein
MKCRAPPPDESRAAAQTKHHASGHGGIDKSAPAAWTGSRVCVQPTKSGGLDRQPTSQSGPAAKGICAYMQQIDRFVSTTYRQKKTRVK